MKAYHQARRVWLAAVHRRQRLLDRLAQLQVRLARHQASLARRHLKEVYFELNGVWYQQLIRVGPVAAARHQGRHSRGPTALRTR